MSISDMLSDAQSALKAAKKKYKFKKTNLAREEAVALQETLAKCRGKLEICKNDLNRTIKNQSKNIKNGKNSGADTLIQEQSLWDAAIGYMLVGDAIFALETINSYDAVSHAYEMLDVAMKQMTGKKNGFPGHLKIGAAKERNVYGYITSSSALKEKEELLDCFYEELKISGDIDACLSETRIPGARQAELRHAYSSGNEPAETSDIDERMNRLNGVQNASVRAEDFEQRMDSMTDIHPPKSSV